jgi:hypothetical protein
MPTSVVDNCAVKYSAWWADCVKCIMQAADATWQHMMQMTSGCGKAAALYLIDKRAAKCRAVKRSVAATDAMAKMIAGTTSDSLR